jgi:pilus assembly protein CpaE
MTDKIQIMLVDAQQVTRDNIRKLLEFEQDMEVVCEAATGEEAVEKARRLLPDIILMELNMPGLDGIAATEIITNEMEKCLTILVSVHDELEYLRRAMAAGAKDYLVKPFDGGDLAESVRRVYSRGQKRQEKSVPAPAQPPAKEKTPALGKVISLFSTKGGVGKTTIATNLAAALGLDGASRVCIIDVALQFGDVALFLDLVPQATIADLLQEDLKTLTDGVLEQYMTRYRDNVAVLAAPARPEQADAVAPERLAAVITRLRRRYDYIILDTASLLNDIVFNILDASDLIIMAVSQDLPTLKNMKLCLEILDSLHYPAEKIKIVLNRANSVSGMNITDPEALLKRKFLSVLPRDEITAVTAVNQGVPFVIGNPDTAVARNMIQLASDIASGEEAFFPAASKPAAVGPGVIGKVARLFKNNGDKAPENSKLRNDGKETADSSVWSF